MTPSPEYPEDISERERWLRNRLAKAGAGFARLVTGGPKTSKLELMVTQKTNGVGSKTTIATAMKKYDTIGIDAVALSVNDIVACGAAPALLTRYLNGASDNSEARKARDDILKGIETACRDSAVQYGTQRVDVAMLGGEVATTPDVIRPSSSGYAFDLSTTCLGITDGETIIDGRKILAGDAVIGLGSTGLHSNGFSFFRSHLFREFGNDAPLSLHDECPLGRTWGAQLLTPTRIYVEPITQLIFGGCTPHGITHISNSGFRKLTRTLPPKTAMVLDNLPSPPPIFEAILSRLDPIHPTKMYEALNMGVGMCVTLPHQKVDRAMGILEKMDLEAQVIGNVVEASQPSVTLTAQNVVY